MFFAYGTDRLGYEKQTCVDTGSGATKVQVKHTASVVYVGVSIFSKNYCKLSIVSESFC